MAGIVVEETSAEGDRNDIVGEEAQAAAEMGTMLISTIDGHITAIDALSGRTKWKFKECMYAHKRMFVRKYIYLFGGVSVMER